MRALTGPLTAALEAVITSPGHLIYLGLTPTPARWSDIGQVTTADGSTWAAVDMKVGGIGLNGDGVPSGFSLELGNLDSAVGALILAHDIAGAQLTVYGVDRAALTLNDLCPLGNFQVTSARIGLDAVTLSCGPMLYHAPVRRIDAANGFARATPAGTKVTWGQEFTILQQSRFWEDF